MQQLKQKYNDEVRPALVQQFGYSSVMAAPRIEKIVVNEGPGVFQGRQQGHRQSRQRTRA